ncbi:MAG: hypothetical protein MI746_11210 [Pseudomonadales bacterium]|nr:hypothetical protein [Pseudomonadales bacterium]
MQLFKKKVKQQGRVGVTMVPGKLALAHLEQRDGAPHLLGCEVRNLESRDDLESELSKLVKEMDLAEKQCSYVLSPDEYSLHLVEAPNVEPEELRSAVRWSVKDLLDMKIDEAAIDVFPVPEDAYRGRKMVYVVAANRNRIQKIVELVTKADLELAIIDIPELAMKNISTSFIDDANGAAFMDLRRTGSTMNITHSGDLYLTRRINTQMEPDVMQSSDWENLRDRLVLEIQRSLDYYESQMGKGQVTKIVIAQRQTDTAEIVRVLNDALTAQVTALNMLDHMQCEATLSTEMQQLASAAIGATLRGIKKQEVKLPDPETPEPSPEPPPEETPEQEAA